MASRRAVESGDAERDRGSVQPRRSPDDAAALQALQRAAGNAAVTRALREPMDPSLRSRLEPRFGVDLSRVPQRGLRESGAWLEVPEAPRSPLRRTPLTR